MKKLLRKIAYGIALALVLFPCACLFGACGGNTPKNVTVANFHDLYGSSGVMSNYWHSSVLETDVLYLAVGENSQDLEVTEFVKRNVSLGLLVTTYNDNGCPDDVEKWSFSGGSNFVPVTGDDLTITVDDHVVEIEDGPEYRYNNALAYVVYLKYSNPDYYAWVNGKPTMQPFQFESPLLVIYPAQGVKRPGNPSFTYTGDVQGFVTNNDWTVSGDPATDKVGNYTTTLTLKPGRI